MNVSLTASQNDRILDGALGTDEVSSSMNYKGEQKYKVRGAHSSMDWERCGSQAGKL